MTETAYYGDILTLARGAGLYAEALLVRNGRIICVGSRRHVQAFASPGAKCVELDGRTLMPGFIDSHSHILRYSQSLGSADLTLARSFADIGRALTAFKRESGIPDGQFVTGFGYEHNLLAERRHPTRADLDALGISSPLLITHRSGHAGALSSSALDALDAHGSAHDENGAERDASGELTGYMEESAFIRFASMLPRPGLHSQLDMMRRAQRVYASHGITTAQEGFLDADTLTLFDALRENGELSIDVIGYIDCAIAGRLTPASMRYLNHMRLGGLKLFLDGSPQAKTAWLSQPYIGGDSLGYRAHSDSEAAGAVSAALARGVQLAAHCNGDAACEQLIRAYEAVMAGGRYSRAHRPVMVHAQLVRSDQLLRMRKIGIIPSFFISHIRYWAQAHLDNLGMRRAERISPAKSALALGLPFTLHQDTPVLPPNQLELVELAVTRQAAFGSLGLFERISPLDALRAVTGNAAFQCFEEHSKGALRPSMRADMVILDRNPLRAHPTDIGAITVLETIKDGVTVFRR
ncbi:MAG: amidohydrolase [Clostridia bacterium]|nr:amidohydrolase [Clostridia bacterium]